MSRGFILLLGFLSVCGLGCAEKPQAGTSITPTKEMVRMGTAVAITTPYVEKAEDVKLPDGFPVVGVVVNGQARAYSIAALAPFTGHVVNDLIGDVPVSVTYCDLTSCLRVFTHEQRGEPIQLMTVGRTNEGLLLRYQGRIYSQVAGAMPGEAGEEPPLPKVRFEETTWKAWQQKYPHSEVYLGNATPTRPVPPTND